MAEEDKVHSHLMTLDGDLEEEMVVQEADLPATAASLGGHHLRRGLSASDVAPSFMKPRTAQ